MRVCAVQWGGGYTTLFVTFIYDKALSMIFSSFQTGSGKTYTMGTGFEVAMSPEMVGIIPRAVEHLFSGIEQRRKAAAEANQPPPEFKVNAQFMEVSGWGGGVLTVGGRLYKLLNVVDFCALNVDVLNVRLHQS